MVAHSSVSILRVVTGGQRMRDVGGQAIGAIIGFPNQRVALRDIRFGIKRLLIRGLGKGHSAAHSGQSEETYG